MTGGKGSRKWESISVSISSITEEHNMHRRSCVIQEMKISRNFGHPNQNFHPHQSLFNSPVVLVLDKGRQKCYINQDARVATTWRLVFSHQAVTHCLWKDGYITPVIAVSVYVLQPNVISDQTATGKLECEIVLCTNDWEQCVCTSPILYKCQSRTEGDHDELNNQLKPLQDYAVVITTTTATRLSKATNKGCWRNYSRK